MYMYVVQALVKIRFTTHVLYTMSSDYVAFGHKLRRPLRTNLCSKVDRESLDICKTYCSPYIRVYLLKLQRVGITCKGCGEVRTMY